MRVLQSDFRLRAALAILAVVSRCIPASAQSDIDSDLQIQLANESTRQAAVDEIARQGPGMIQRLLSWERDFPNDRALDIGLCMAFGRLKAKEAIPFLVDHINLTRHLDLSGNTWSRASEVILDRLPAVVVLIQIGPAASQAIIGTYWKQLSGQDRLAAIFVVSRIKGVPEAREFLARFMGQDKMEHYYAEQGLKLLDEAGAAPAKSP